MNSSRKHPPGLLAMWNDPKWIETATLIYIGLFFIGGIAAGFYVLRRHKAAAEKPATAKGQALRGLLMVAVLLPFVLLNQAADFAKWNAVAFSGAILSVEVGSHGMRRYRIEGGPEFTDEQGEMEGFTTGDRVEKHAGERRVTRIP